MSRSAAGGIQQRGVALIVLLALVSFVLVTVLLTTARGANEQVERQRRTALALGMARDALIARAVSDAGKPGSLPCPDLMNDGVADLFAGANCPAYLGRLPWKTLDLPLRDGYGERLWYALSPNFRDLPTTGPFPTTGVPLNSDTAGQLTVAGLVPGTNIIAVVFSAGPPLNGQDRDSANENNPVNYLEGANPTGGTTNNFALGPATPTFNDQGLAITGDPFWPAIEQRVARQTLDCLYRFSTQPGANNRFPWAAADHVTYNDVDTILFGRVPTNLDKTNNSLGLAPSTVGWPNDVPQPGASPSPCFDSTKWWGDWRELLFYKVAEAAKPDVAPPGSCPVDCLYVNGQDSILLVVTVAGRTIPANPSQVHPTDSPSDYLETEPVSMVNNAAGASTFARANATYSATINFNDRLVCLRTSPTAACP